MGMSGATLKNLNLCFFFTFLQLILTKVCFHCLVLVLVPTKGCWFGSESELQELELSVLLQTKQLVNTSFYSMELQNVQFVKLGLLLVVKILRKQRDATHMKF